MTEDEKRIDIGRLRSCLRYEPETGLLFWLILANSKVRTVGQLAGCLNAQGYIVVGLDTARLKGHRIGWALMTGSWPVEEIDHRNGVRDDNRWTNLRASGHSANNMNKPPQSNNQTGYKGVSFAKRENRFRAQICVNGRKIHCGYHLTAEAAARAFDAAAALHHQEFAFLNFPDESHS